MRAARAWLYKREGISPCAVPSNTIPRRVLNIRNMKNARNVKGIWNFRNIRHVNKYKISSIGVGFGYRV